MTDKDKRMELPKISLDDLFTTQEQRDAEDYVIPIPLDQIDDFPNHPYKVRDDDKMKELSESIGERCYIRNDLIFNSYGNIIRPLNENEIKLYDKIKIFKNVLHFYLE